MTSTPTHGVAAGTRLVVTRRASLRHGQHATVSPVEALSTASVWVRFDGSQRDLLWDLDAFEVAR